MNVDKFDKKYFEDIEKSNYLFNNILNDYHFEIPNAINLSEEKKIFLSNYEKNKVYNPQIEFDLKKFYLTDFYKMRFKLSYLLHIEENEKDKFGIKTLYKGKLYQIYNKINYHDFWGEKQSTKFIKNCYGKPSFFLVLKAKWFCKFLKEDYNNSEKISKEEIGKFIKEEIIKKYKIRANVNYKYLNKDIKYCEKRKEFLISDNSDYKFFKEDFLRIKFSEIDIFYRRYVNGINSKIKLFEFGTRNSLETEYGLKLYYQNLQGVLSNEKLKFYAGLCIASRYCLSKSFYKVFKILKRYNFSDDDAFEITYRVKRNLFDTSKKGGFTKDYLHYSGYMKVQKFALKNDLKNLFIGRIGIKDLKLLSNFIKEKKFDFESPFDVKKD